MIPLPCLGNIATGSKANTVVELSGTSLQNLLYEAFCHLVFLVPHFRTGSSDAKGHKGHIEHPGDLHAAAGGASGGGGTGKTLDRIVNAKEEVSQLFSGKFLPLR